jgi:FKBP-type peptidyl-prolyl cis-trans isomerase FklB
MKTIAVAVAAAVVVAAAAFLILNRPDRPVHVNSASNAPTLTPFADTGQIAAAALKRSQAFLAENAKKEGVVALPDGLQYKVIAPGSGDSPGLEDTVKVNYEGKLIDGVVFDSSERHGGPAQFVLGHVIKGWQEAVQLMKVGAKWELYIPPNLAYGERGAPPFIGPNEALVFTVELLDVQKP